jgi:hypothetical protein
MDRYCLLTFEALLSLIFISFKDQNNCEISVGTGTV